MRVALVAALPATALAGLADALPGAADFAAPAGFAAVLTAGRVVAGLATAPTTLALPAVDFDEDLAAALATAPLPDAAFADAVLADWALVDAALVDAALVDAALTVVAFVAAPFAPDTLFAATRATDFPVLAAASERTPLVAGCSDWAARAPDCLLTFARVFDPVAVDFLMLTLNPFGKLGARLGASREKEPNSVSRLVTQ